MRRLAVALSLLLAACGGTAAPASPAPSGAAPSFTKASAAPLTSPKPSAGAADQKPADASPSKLVMAYGQPNIHNSILWIAVEKGLFKKYSVDAQMTQVTGPAITQGLTANALELVFSSAASPFIAHLEGGDTVLIGSNVNQPPTDIVVNPNKIAKPEDRTLGPNSEALFGAALRVPAAAS
jgi:ABC-type nitrate/sulfonate/bicarbonate transport system substrate-binding protein